MGAHSFISSLFGKAGLQIPMFHVNSGPCLHAVWYVAAWNSMFSQPTSSFRELEGSEELSTPETNSNFAPENSGLENYIESFPFWSKRRFLLQVQTAKTVSFKEVFFPFFGPGKKKNISWGSSSGCHHSFRYRPETPKHTTSFRGASKSVPKNSWIAFWFPPEESPVLLQDLDDVWFGWPLVFPKRFFFQGNKKCWKRVTLWSPLKPSYTRSFLARFLERKIFGKCRHPSLEPRCHHGYLTTYLLGWSSK